MSYKGIYIIGQKLNKKKTHLMVGQFMASRRGIEPLLQE